MDFDPATAVITITPGRYEYVNKGLDVLVAALAKLDKQLKVGIFIPNYMKRNKLDLKF
jgi:hypothetical protein